MIYFAVIATLPLVLTLGWLYYSQFSVKRTIVDTGETNAQVAITATLFILWQLISLVLLLNLFNKLTNNSFSQNLLNLEFSISITIYSIILIYPWAVLLFILPRFNRYYYKRYRLYAPDNNDCDYLFIKNIVSNLSLMMGLKADPIILFSSEPNISPFTFSAGPIKSYLACPSNFTKMLSRSIPADSADGNEPIKKVCSFIIAHEIAHIANRDVFAVSYLLRLKKYLWIYILLLTGFTAAHFLLPADISRIFKYELITTYFPFIATALLIIYTTNRISEKREALADARASVYFPNNFIESVIKPINKVLIEIDMRAHIDNQIARPGFLHFSRKIKSNNDTLHDRLLKVINRQLVSERGIFPASDISAWIGIAFCCYNILLAVGFNWNFRKIDFDISAVVAMQNYIFIPAAIIGFLIFSYAITISRRKTFNSIKLSKEYFNSLLRCFSVFSIFYIIGLVFFGCTFWAVNEFLSVPIDLTTQYPRYLSLPFYIITITGIFELVSINMPDNIDNKGKFFEEILVVGVFMGIAIPTLLFILLNYVVIEIPIVQNFALIGLVLTLFNLISHKYAPNKISWSGIITGKIFWKKISLELYKLQRVTRIYYISQFICYLVLIPLTIPLIIFYSASYLITNYSGPIAWGNYDIYSVGIMFISLAIAWNASRRNTGMITIKHWNWIHYCVNIGGMLFFDLSNRYKTELWELMASIINPAKLDSKISIFAENISSDVNVSKLVSWYHIANKIKYNTAHISNKIFEYECSEGGFSLHPGLSPLIEATFICLSIIQDAGKLKTINCNKHAKWIMANCRGNFFSDTVWDKPYLRTTYHALKSLEILHSVDAVNDKEEIADELSFLWKNSKRNEEETYYFVESLIILEMLSPEIIRNLKESWLLEEQNIILNTRIDRHYEATFYYLSILKSLGITEDISIDRIREEFIKSDFFKQYIAEAA